MDKYKVIAEKITYSLDGYIADHNNRNFGDADGWLRHVRNGWEEFIEAHPDSLNLHEHLQHQQAKVEELQLAVDSLAEENANFRNKKWDQNEDFTKLQIERDELQNLYTQQGINMLKLQKRVDAVNAKLDHWRWFLGEFPETPLGERIQIQSCIDDLEQALKGEGQ
ncbi:hypothetical protein NQ809_06645 [Acinetobacter baumannii]|nr:hypothetical protein [Acinetobacter baumannii]